MWLNNLYTICCGAGVDWLIGDPPRIPHPVVGFGRLIAFWEQLFNRKGLAPWLLRIYGTLTVLTTVGVAYLIPFFLLKWLSPTSWLFWPVNIWLMATTIAAKGLNQAGQRIAELLREDDINGARTEVGMVVGRDTANLSQEGITRAAVETIAENTVDGVIAPIFFGLLGGAPLALAYRAVNTLDSMIGYKNDRYRYFGWAAARLDDAANYIPARIGAFFIFLSASLMGLNWRGSIKTTFRDARKHPSPNGGWPEAAVAGALGVRLGGQNYYQGVPAFRNYLGDPARGLEIEDIERARRILNMTLGIMLVASGLIVLIVYF
ncbi:MAG: adenosylcobinamide-phosphate synthase CbiB [Bacillota bacterium]